MSNDQTVLLDFYSEMCSPCKMLMRDLEEMSSSLNGVEVKKLNIMDNYDLTEKYNIRSVPTLVILKDNEKSAVYTGYKGKADLQKFLAESL